MPCRAKEAGGVYRPRHPQQTPFYQLVERFYPEFEAVYEERYGFRRPIIGTVVRKFLACGDLKHGFARVRCPRCREELFVPFSCRGRCFCPSGHEKRALEKAGWVAEHICAQVPHRQFVSGAAPAGRVHHSQAVTHLFPVRPPAPGRPVPSRRAHGDQQAAGRRL
jgi:hypothetical protein